MSDRGADWYKREPRAFLEGVRRLTEREIAVYAVVLDLIYDGGHQTLNDPKHIASYFSDLGVAAVRRTIAGLCDAGKLDLDGEYLTNKRARTEGKTRRQLSELRQNAGRLGGLSSAKSRAKTKDNSGLAEANGSAKLQQVSRLEGEGEKKDTLVGSPTLKPAAPDRFEEFWEAYPQRLGDNPKKPAREKFASAVKRGVDPERIIAAARSFAARCPTKSQHTPMAASWLHQERYADADAIPTASAATDVDWAKRLRYARQHRSWALREWGPMPGMPGCLVPADLIQPGDGDGWAPQREAA